MARDLKSNITITANTTDLERSLAHLFSVLSTEKKMGIDMSGTLSQIEKVLSKFKELEDRIAKLNLGTVRKTARSTSTAGGLEEQLSPQVRKNLLEAYKRQQVEFGEADANNQRQSMTRLRLHQQEFLREYERQARAKGRAIENIDKKERKKWEDTALKAARRKIEQEVNLALGGTADTNRAKAVQERAREDILKMTAAWSNQTAEIIRARKEAEAYSREMQQLSMISTKAQNTFNKGQKIYASGLEEQAARYGGSASGTTPHALQQAKALRDANVKANRDMQALQKSMQYDTYTPQARGQTTRQINQLQGQITQLRAMQAGGGLTVTQSKHADTQIAKAEDTIYKYKGIIQSIQHQQGVKRNQNRKITATTSQWNVIGSADEAFKQAHVQMREDIWGVDVNALNSALDSERKKKAEAERLARNAKRRYDKKGKSADNSMYLEQQKIATETGGRVRDHELRLDAIVWARAKAEAEAMGNPGGFVNPYAQALASASGGTRHRTDKIKVDQFGGRILAPGAVGAADAEHQQLQRAIQSAQNLLRSKAKLTADERQEINTILKKAIEDERKYVLDRATILQKDLDNQTRHSNKLISQANLTAKQKKAADKLQREQDAVLHVTDLSKNQHLIKGLTAAEVSEALEALKINTHARSNPTQHPNAVPVAVSDALNEQLRRRRSDLGKPGFWAQTQHWLGIRGIADGQGGVHKFGRENDNLFHNMNKRVTNMAQMMGTSLYGMGIFGAGSAMVKGTLGSAAEKESMVNTLGGLVNTFATFKNVFGEAASSSENFIKSVEFSGTVYDQVREKASKSILTTKEMFDYFMSGAPQLMAKGMNTGQSLKIVNAIASLGKSMGLSSTAVQSDVRDFATGQVTVRSQVLRTMGFNKQDLQKARSEGPDAMEAYFDKVMKGFEPALKHMQDMTQSKMAQFSNALQQAGIDIGEKLAPKLIPIVERMTVVIRKWAEDGTFDRFATSFGGFVETVMENAASFIEFMGPLVANVNTMVWLVLLGAFTKFALGMALEAPKVTAALQSAGVGFLGVLTAVVTGLIMLGSQANAARQGLADKVEKLPEYRRGSGFAPEEQKSIDKRTLESLRALGPNATFKDAVDLRRTLGMKESELFNQLTPDQQAILNAGTTTVANSGDYDQLNSPMWKVAKVVSGNSALKTLAGGIGSTFSGYQVTNANEVYDQLIKDYAENAPNQALIHNLYASTARNVIGSEGVAGITRSSKSALDDANFFDAFRTKYKNSPAVMQAFVRQLSTNAGKGLDALSQGTGLWTPTFKGSANLGESMGIKREGDMSIFKAKSLGLERTLGRLDSVIGRSADGLAKGLLIDRRLGVATQHLGLNFQEEQSQLKRQLYDAGGDPIKTAAIQFEMARLPEKYAKTLEELQRASEDQLRTTREAILTQQEENKYRKASIDLIKQQTAVNTLEYKLGRVDQTTTEGRAEYDRISTELFQKKLGIQKSKLDADLAKEAGSFGILQSRGDSASKVSGFFGVKARSSAPTFALDTESLEAITEGARVYKEAVAAVKEVADADKLAAELQKLNKDDLVSSLDGLNTTVKSLDDTLKGLNPTPATAPVATQQEQQAWADANTPPELRGQGSTAVLPKPLPDGSTWVDKNTPSFMRSAAKGGTKLGKPADVGGVWVRGVFIPKPGKSKPKAKSAPMSGTIGGEGGFVPAGISNTQLEAHGLANAGLYANSEGDFIGAFQSESNKYSANLLAQWGISDGLYTQSLQERSILGSALPGQTGLARMQAAISHGQYGLQNGVYGYTTQSTNAARGGALLALAKTPMSTDSEQAKTMWKNLVEATITNKSDKAFALAHPYDSGALKGHAESLGDVGRKQAQLLASTSLLMTTALNQLGTSVSTSAKRVSLRWSQQIKMLSAESWMVPMLKRSNALEMKGVEAGISAELLGNTASGDWTTLLAKGSQGSTGSLKKILDYKVGGKDVFTNAQKAQLAIAYATGGMGAVESAGRPYVAKAIAEAQGSLTGSADMAIAKNAMQDTFDTNSRNAGFTQSAAERDYRASIRDYEYADAYKYISGSSSKNINDTYSSAMDDFARSSEMIQAKASLTITQMQSQDMKAKVGDKSVYAINLENNPNYYTDAHSALVSNGQTALLKQMRSTNWAGLRRTSAYSAVGTNFSGMLFNNPQGVVNGSAFSTDGIRGLTSPLLDNMSNRMSNLSQNMMGMLSGNLKMSDIVANPELSKFVSYDEGGNALFNKAGAMKAAMGEMAGNLGGQYGGMLLGSAMFPGKDPGAIGLGASLGTALLPSMLNMAGPWGAVAGGLLGGALGGLFGGNKPDPEEQRRKEREKQHQDKLVDLLSKIDKSLRPQADYFRTIKGDVLYGSSSRWYSGRAYAQLGLQGAVGGR